MRTFALAALMFLAAAVGADGAFAAATGQPEPWALGFQPSATPMRDAIDALHDYLLVVITAISVFVLALLVWVIVRYRRSANPEAAQFSHNTTIEVIWTAIPVLILLTIGVPSFRLLYYVETIPEADMTLKVTGYQWNWEYEYPDHGGFSFFANMVPEGEAGRDYFGNPQPRLLATDEDVVVPVGSVVRVEVTAADVLHNFAMPAFGLKTDAVPGQINQTWFKVDTPGMYYGQCSEICGIRHAYMPIAIRAVSQAEFDQWVAEQQALAGITPPAGDDQSAALAADEPNPS